MDPEPLVNEELKRTMAIIRDRFNTIKILQRNFDTCVEAAKSNQGLFSLDFKFCLSIYKLRKKIGRV